MRIFVGTLYTIENEFDECVASIERQRYRDFEHFVLRDLPKKEAHDALYGTFMNRSDEFELMIKVDADMVLASDELFGDIVDRFHHHPELKHLQIAVHDFFTDRLIWALHACRNTMVWETRGDRLFTDSYAAGPGERISDDTHLAPAAFHCKNPSLFQAFHYGVHKALKVVQPDRPVVREQYAKHHWENVERTRSRFADLRDLRLGMAVLGAELVYRGGIGVHHISYSDPFLRDLFETHRHLTHEGLGKEIRKLAALRFGYLPDEWRRRTVIRMHQFQRRLGRLRERLRRC